MPGVYQPTTTTNQRGGNHSFLSLKILKKPIFQFLVLISALLLLAIGKYCKIFRSIIQINFNFSGISMIASGAADFSDTTEHEDELNNTNETKEEEGIDIGIVVGGVFLTIIGFCLLGLYIKVCDWRRNCICPCGLSKKQGLARTLQNQGNNPPNALNHPSTDFLVSHTQYAPISELPSAEECRNLMPDNKECLSSAEESDKFLDSDPRIVLRPIHHDDV